MANHRENSPLECFLILLIRRNPLRQTPQGLPVRHSSGCNHHLQGMSRERVLTLGPGCAPNMATDWGYRLSPAARSNLARIWRHMASEWSAAQAKNHQDALTAAFDGMEACANDT